MWLLHLSERHASQAFVYHDNTDNTGAEGKVYKRLLGVPQQTIFLTNNYVYSMMVSTYL